MRLRTAAGLLATTVVAGLGAGVSAAQAATPAATVRANAVVNVGSIYELVTFQGNQGRPKCANVAGGSTRPGAQLITWRCVGSSNELFDFVPSSNDGVNQYYQIRNENSRLCFELPNESGADGTPIEQASCTVPFDTEQYRVQPTGTPSSVTVFALVSKRFPNMCVTRLGDPAVPNDNDKMALVTCNLIGNGAQLWVLG